MNELFTAKEKDLLDFTINKRHSLIKALTKDTEDVVPEKGTDKILLNSLLDGLDKAIHTKAKLSIEDKQNQQQEEVASILGDILNKIKPKEYAATNTVNRNANDIPQHLVLENEVPGEAVMGGDNINYSDFVKTEE